MVQNLNYYHLIIKNDLHKHIVDMDFIYKVINLGYNINTLVPKKYNKNKQNDEIIQLIKLHTQIGQEIINSVYGPYKLPTKKEFNWTLGKKVKLLKEKYKSDYAIFIFFRDQYSSTERVIYNIVTAFLFPGIIPIGGSQIAFASLVNLNNGEVTWFNGYYRSFGDVRDLENARDTVNKLFEEFPG